MKTKKAASIIAVISLTIALVTANTLWVFAGSSAENTAQPPITTQDWTMTEVVSTESTDDSAFPSLAVGPHGKVHIAWDDDTDYGGSGTDIDIFYKRFEPSVGWTATEVVSTDSTAISRESSLGVGSDGKVHIAWADDTDYGGCGTDTDIFYKRFEPDSGWTATEVVSTESTGDSFNPSLAVGSDGKVHIAWDDYTNDYDGSGTDTDIYYKRFEPSSGWTLTEVASKASTYGSYGPSLDVGSDGTVHITWHEWSDYGGSGTDGDIFYTRFVPGSGWMTTEVVSTESTDRSVTSSLGVGSDGKVHIAWADDTDYGGCGTDVDVFYKRFEPGSGWMTTEVVSTESTHDSEYPSLGVGSDGKVHIAWNDGTDYGGSGLGWDVFYKRFEPGVGWTTTEVVSTESTSGTYTPSLDVGSDGTVHMTWHDWTDYGGCGTDVDIFYKRFMILVADAGGPYITFEGDYVTLDASGSHYPLGDIISYEWDLDDDGLYDDATGVTATFTTVGQDDVYPIALKVTAFDGSEAFDQTEVAVFNSSPTVYLSSDSPKDQFSTVTVTGTVTDKGWLDPLKAEINWGDGSPPEPTGGTLENVEPDATLTFSVSHVYSEAGTYMATVYASDDDITKFVFFEIQINSIGTFQYHFRLNPYIDVFHMNLTDDGWLKGLVTTPSYAMPLVGKYENGKAYIAWDLPAGGIEMGFAVISAASGTGQMMRIMDDLSLIGPEPVGLTVAASTSQCMDDPTLAEAVASEVSTQAVFEFVMNPFHDVATLDTGLAPWLWGWADAPGPSYPAPILGYYESGRFYYAMDSIDGKGISELVFAAGSVCTRDGYILRAPQGFGDEDPIHIWLTTP